MRSRRFPILLLGAISLLTSCSQKEEPSAAGGRICFSGLAQERQSRAEELPQDYRMWVHAIHHLDGGHSLFFSEAKEFEYKNSQWSGSATDYYYPPLGIMDFFAYAVYGPGKSSQYLPDPEFSFAADFSAFGDLTLDFGDRLDGKDAILYSDVRRAACGSSSSIQQLRFRHALAMVQFRASTNDASTASNLTIHRVSLRQNVVFSGIVTVIPGVPGALISDDPTPSSAVWSLPLSGSPRQFEINLSPGVKPRDANVTPGAYAALGTPYYLPPQSDTPQNYTLDVEYTIMNASGAETPHYTKSVTLENVKWEPGMQYTYSLVCGLTEIRVEEVSGAIVDDWNNEDGEEDGIISEQLYKGTTVIANK